MTPDSPNPDLAKPDTEPETAVDKETSDAARPIKQMLAWAMGDREMEAEALAEETAKQTSVSQQDALQAARLAIAEAHGDLGVSDKDPFSSDVARPSDVQAVVEAEHEAEQGKASS
jgi:hypothetical protein